ncbi:MAG TPA: hypothetical protein VN706_21065 [Gemmatimonadaceae bacterium]|nr:hypothetical protein [Gemmatimonadaceae bacterium]
MNRPTMWRAILETQWKWCKGLALLGVLIVFAIPLVSLRTAAFAADEARVSPLATFVLTMQGWGVGYAIAAGALGLATAMLAWASDHRLRHVYALSLPIARWRYVWYRFAAGILMLVIPVIALLIATEIVAHSSMVPKELHAYPLALTLRFAFATLVAYALFFAISAATPRTAGYILGAIALIIVAQVVLSSANSHIDILSHAIDVLFATPGLLAVFGGRWALVDV